MSGIPENHNVDTKIMNQLTLYSIENYNCYYIFLVVFTRWGYRLMIILLMMAEAKHFCSAQSNMESSYILLLNSISSHVRS